MDLLNNHVPTSSRPGRLNTNYSSSNEEMYNSRQAAYKSKVPGFLQSVNSGRKSMFNTTRSFFKGFKKEGKLMSYYKQIKRAFDTNEPEVIRTLQTLLRDEYNKTNTNLKTRIQRNQYNSDIRKDWGKYRALIMYVEFLLKVLNNQFPDKEDINKYIKRMRVDEDRTSNTGSELVRLIIKDMTEIQFSYMLQQNEQKGGRRRKTRKNRRN